MTALLPPPRRVCAIEVGPIPAAVRARMEGVSWRGDDARCPRWEQLAYVQVDHVTFDGSVARGELVVATAIAHHAVALMRRLYEMGFPIRRMTLVDAYGASD